MLTTIEAEIDVNGEVKLMEPVKIKRRSRAIVTVIEGEDPKVGQGSTPIRETVRELFGSISLGQPTGVDNDKLDAVLAEEYGNGDRN